MIKVSREKWNKIHNDYKGVWSRADVPEYVGKKTVMSGSIGEEIGSLLIESIHFVIVD